MGDDQTLAMVLNSLGGVLERLGKTGEASEAFASSINLGVKLKDDMHLAKVRTAYGKALVFRGDLAAGVEQLCQGFSFDERSGNRRGLAIVTPIIVDTLRRLGRSEEAVLFVRRASAIAPNERAIQRLITFESDTGAGLHGPAGGARCRC